MLSSLIPFLPTPPNSGLQNSNSLNYCFFVLFSTSIIVCTASPCSNLSKSFTKSYPQNCTKLSSLTIAEQSSVITSCALQAELLFIHPSTAFASFSTTNNHVQLVILFYAPQSFSAELWSSWSFSALYLCRWLLLPKYNSLHLSLLNYISLFQCISPICQDHYKF